MRHNEVISFLYRGLYLSLAKCTLLSASFVLMDVVS